MAPKKTKRADLENKRSLFLLAGFVIALMAALIVFEWRSTPSEIVFLEPTQKPVFDPVQIPINRTETELPKPKVQVKILDKIEVVDNNSKQTTIDGPVEAVGNPNEPILLITNNEPEPMGADDTPVNFADEMPRFMGKDGAKGFMEYIAKNLRYPQEAIDNGITGRVNISFVVDKQGKVIQIRITRGVHPLLDTEALRVIATSPEWTPGKQGTKTVAVQYNLPVIFRLQ